MADLFRYLSWNIQQFSEKHGDRDVLMTPVHEWISRLVLDMEANVVGVMEVTLGTGEFACEQLRKALDDRVGVPGTWSLIVSDESGTRRADRYGVFSVTKPFTSFGKSFAQASVTGAYVDKTKNWLDRGPFVWLTTGGGATVNSLLWHAPQPAYNEGTSTMQTLAELTDDIAAGGNLNFVVSGDFNWDTSSTAAYAPLTSRQFAGAFDGQATTMTTVKSFENNNRAQLLGLPTPDPDAAFLASRYDNIFLKTVHWTGPLRMVLAQWMLDVMLGGAPVTPLPSQAAAALAQARRLSDHLPLALTVTT